MLRNITRIIFILLGLLAFGTGPVWAATITVTANAPDVLNSINNTCALREAITNINNGTATFGDCGQTGTYGINDTIILPAGTYTNTLAGNGINGENLNVSGDLDISKSVIINGPAFTPPALPTAIIDGGGATIGRVFHLVTNGITVSINNVIIQNGNATIDGNLFGPGAGSGINSGGSGDALTVTNSIIQNNGPGGDGGGIFCWSGTLTVTGSSIINNTTGGGNASGGGIHAHNNCTALTITKSHIDSNIAGVNGGGGIDNFTNTAINITGSTISNNTTQGNGGGIRFNSGTMTITSSTINGNSSAIGGGGINYDGTVVIHSSTISNNTTPLGSFGGGIASRFNAVSLTIDDSMGTGSTISGNTANLGGGGIAVFKGATTISDTTISSNTTTTGDGGGIRIEGGSAVTITNTAISGNTATAGRGGGVFNTGSTATVSNSTISGNTAKTSGGGIRHLFSIATRLFTLVNSTISGNTVTGAGATGGGVETNDALTAINTTITNNTAAAGGGIQISGGTAVNLKNTIVANQAAGGDCSVAVTSTLNDLDSDGSCGVGTTAANALLDPLAANGGPIPTQTHTLLTGSPALDVGDAVTCLSVPVNNFDQRGLPRPQGTVCDIGAVEANHQPQPTAPNIINTGVAASSQVTHHDPDTANPGNTWTYSVLTSPANGGAIVDVGGFSTYTPNPGWFGPDTFVIKVQDNGILPLSGTVTVIVKGSNKPPVPTAPAITTNEDTVGTSQIAPNDPNLGDAHTYLVTTAPANGGVVVNAAGLATYTPNLNFNGTDIFTVKVTDNGTAPPNLSGSVTINVTVNPVNDAPAPTAPAIVTNEDTPATSQVTHNDPDIGDTHAYAVTTAPANGGATVDATGLATYTPNLNFNGADSFTVTVTDAAGATGAVAINVTVNPVNDAPAPTAPAITTNEDTPAGSQVAHNDPDVGDTHTYAVTTPPANGGVVVNAAGLATYTPNLNFNGVDSFTVTVTDAAGATGAVAINVTINPVNDAPAPTGPAITTNVDVAATSQISPNDPDPGDTHTYTVTTAAVSGTVVVDAAGLATYTPNAGFSGTDSFTVTVTDAAGATGAVAISVTVKTAVIIRYVSDGGCAINPSTSFDPTMLLMLLISGAYLMRKRDSAN